MKANIITLFLLVITHTGWAQSSTGSGFIKKVGSGYNGRLAHDQYGVAVALHEDIMAVGAHYQGYDSAGENYKGNSGAVYLYYRNKDGEGAWGLVKKVTLGDVRKNEEVFYFGSSVALYGDVLIVGEHHHGYDTKGKNFVGSAGAVYIFYRNSGGKDNRGLVKKLIATGKNGRKENDEFGYSVALYGDILAVGAHYQDYNASGELFKEQAGAVYMFSRNKGGIDNWGLLKKITPRGINGRVTADFFGKSIALSGNDLIVGAGGQDYDSLGKSRGDKSRAASKIHWGERDNVGAAYIFNRNKGGSDNWGQVKKITPNDSSGRIWMSEFGTAVAISGDLVAVSAPSMQGYDTEHGYENIGVGAVYIFNRNSGGKNNWGMVRKVLASGYNASLGSNFLGTKIALYNDLLAAATIPHSFDSVGENKLEIAGAVFVFGQNTGGNNNWGLVKKVTGFGKNGRKKDDRFGTSVTLYENELAVGAPYHDYNEVGEDSVLDAGAVYLTKIDKQYTPEWLKNITEPQSYTIQQESKVMILKITGILPESTQVSITDSLGNVKVKHITQVANPITKVSLIGLYTGEYTVTLEGEGVKYSEKVTITKFF